MACCFYEGERLQFALDEPHFLRRDCVLMVRDSNPGGMLKTTLSKASADESTGGVAPGYVEDAFKARTTLADVFSVPLKKRPALVWNTETALRTG